MANFEFCLQPDLMLNWTIPLLEILRQLDLNCDCETVLQKNWQYDLLGCFPRQILCWWQVTRSGVWIRTRIIRAEAMSWRWPTSGSGQSREKVATRWAAAGYSRQYHNWRTTRGTQLNNIFTQHPNIFSGAEFLKNMFGASHFYWWCSLI